MSALLNEISNIKSIYMKKSLLTLCAVSAGILAAPAAEQSMEMSYSDKVSTAVGFEGQNPGGTAAAGFLMSPVDVAAYAGLKISTITVYSGAAENPLANPDTEITLLIYNSDSETPVYSQKAEISSTAYARNVVPLDTPYEIKAGEPLFVCYRIPISNRTENWLCVDGKASPDKNVGLCYVGDGTDLPSPSKWLAFGDSYYGAVCMGCTITGETLPLNNAGILNVTPPTSVMIGDKPQFTLDMRNPGNNNIRNFEVLVEATGEEAYSKTVDFKPYFKKSTTNVVSIDLEPFTSAGNKEVKFTVTKVNGEENTNACRVGSASTVSIGEAFTRVPVIEEGTGTWCGWCVAGIVMFEQIKEKYGDKVALIAAHQGDRMAVNSYQPFIYSYMTGLPSAMFNREQKVEVKPGLADDLIDDALSHSIFANIELGELKIDERDKDMATIETFSEFILDTGKNYCVSIALTEDGLGPYTQKNYYSDELNNNSGPMGGWEDKPLETPDVYYNHVARALSNYPGEPLPETEFEARKKIPLTVTMFGMTGIVSGRFRAIAMLTEEDTGYIINAAIKDYDLNATGVRGFGDDNVRVYGGNGHITVTGAPDAEVYNLSGIRTGLDNLAPGIYIVRAGGTVTKVAVK